MSYKFGDQVTTTAGDECLVLRDDAGNVTVFNSVIQEEVTVPRKNLSPRPANEDQIAANHPANFAKCMKVPSPPIGVSQDAKKARNTKGSS